MIDQAREWLGRLHAGNAPEADMALDLLGRLDEFGALEEADDGIDDERRELRATLDDVEGAIMATDALWVPNGLDHEHPAQAVTKLAIACHDLCEALGADGPEEAIAMARTLREAFE
jgi:hypothetical protein